MPTTSSKKPNAKGQDPTNSLKSSTAPVTTETTETPDTAMPDTAHYDGDFESDHDSITKKEKEEEERKLAEGAKDVGDVLNPGGNMAKIPPYILEHYKSLYSAFQRFWTSSYTFKRRTQKDFNGAVKDLLSKNGDSSSQKVAELPFESFIEVKEEALDCLQDADKMNKDDLLNAWLTADKMITDLRQKLKLSGYPEDFGPPEDWIEQNTGLQRPGKEANNNNEAGDGVSSASSSADSGNQEAPAMGPSDEQWNPDAGDSIEELSRASGAELLVAIDGGICGYSRRGGSWEVLAKEGNWTNIRYRLASALQAPTFSPSNPTGQNLALGQRGAERDQKNGVRIWSAIHVVALKGVAWRRSEGDSDDPVKDMSVEQRTYPVTRVLILWDDGKETWETR